MKINLAVLSILLIMAGCGKENKNKELTKVEPFDVITLDCQSVTMYKAVVNGIVLHSLIPTETNTSPPQISFCYSRLPDPDINDSIVYQPRLFGTYTDSTEVEGYIQGLDRNTTYYYRIFARTKDWIRYGEVKSFTTEENWLKPVVDSVYNIGRDSVYIAWRVLKFEDAPTQQYKGVCYKLKSEVNGEFNTCYSYLFNDTNSITIVTGLSPETEYIASAYYQKYGYVKYGDELVFKTMP